MAKRKKTKNKSRVYAYGLPRGPHCNANLVNQQLRRAHTYRNQLTQIEKRHLEMTRALVDARPEIAPHVQRVAALEADLEKAREVITKTRGKTRSRSETPAMRARVDAVLAALKVARADLKEVRGAFYETLKTERDRLKEHKDTAQRSYRKAQKAARERAKEARRIYQQAKTPENKEAYRQAREARDRLPAISDAEHLERIREELRGTMDPDVATFLTLNHARDAAIRAERAIAGLYSGTYQLVEDASKQAVKDVLQKGGQLRFERYRGEGSVSVQIQGGCSIEEALSGEHPQIQIDPIPERAWLKETRRGERRQLHRTRVRLRIGSNAKRQPVWAEWSMMFHRALPPKGRIKRVTAKRVRRDCRTWRWSLLVHVELPRDWRGGKCGEGTVAVNIGWRQMPDGIRILHTRDANAQTDELRLDENIIPRLQKTYELQQLRRKKQNTVQAALTAWFTDQAAILPTWLKDRIKHLDKWRSPRHFVALAHEWRDNRFPGDVVGYELLESWRYRDEHLERWEANLRSKTLGHRREQYRIFAAHLADTYGTLIIENTDYRTWQQSPLPEETRVEWPAAKAQQRASSPSELRNILIDAFRRRGGTVILADPAAITRACHACGADNVWDQARVVVHTCTSCGVAWDQDDNACRNLLNRERSGGPRKAGTARTNHSDTIGGKEESRAA